MSSPFVVEGVESHTIDPDGLRIAYLTAGSAEHDGDSEPPIVLCHGGGLDRAALSWKHTIPALAIDRQVSAPDWPGFGESDSPAVSDEEISTEYFIAVLDRFLDALGMEEVALCGISMGGGVALGYALTNPERVARLALIDSYGLGGVVPGGRLGSLFVRLPWLSEATFEALARSRRLTALTLRSVVASGNLDAALVREMHEIAKRPDSGDTWLAFQRNEVRPQGLRTNYLDYLPDFSVPTLLLHGERDPLVPAAWAVRAGTLIPDCEVRIVPECGHWPPRERSETTNEYLREFC